MIEELWSSLIGFSAQFVIPDWGHLIALLPVLLMIPVALYLTWTVYRLATAAPTRRGKQRLPPVAPAGIHMPGPSFAPFLGAAGMLFVVFGLVAGGIWLIVGFVILTITLLYWGREALRDYDHIPSNAAHATAVGMLPAPAGTPPEGVHIPPPSFRPLLVAISMTVLVAGLIIGGWALFLGAIILVITLVGWLVDAGREYRAVEQADRTGHLDLGGSPRWPTGTFATIAVLIAFAVLFTSGVLPNSNGSADAGTAAGASQAPANASGGPGGSGAPAGSGGPASSGAPSGGPSAATADVSLTAVNIDFSPKTLTAPAGKPFTLGFDNQEAVPHDVVIKSADGATAFTGDVVTGPKTVVYDVPALPAGTYTFNCSIHPNMQGTITAQ